MLDIQERPTNNDADYFGPMAADEYHADRSAVSCSSLKVFRERRRLYHDQYILGNPERRKTTAKMNMGTLTHADILEPGSSQSLYCEMPDFLLSGANRSISSNEAKKWKADKEAKGKIVLKSNEFAAVQEMSKAIRAKFGDWLKMPSKREHAIYWTNTETGIRCKCRPDWLLFPDGQVIDLDVKTTSDSSPDQFQHRVEQCLHWLQVPHYLEGIQHATGKPAEWYFLVVEDEFPFACQLCRLDHQSFENAKTERLRLLESLATCITEDQWGEPWEQTINNLDIKPWKIQTEKY